jgi:biopolymer transport protein ExbD
MAGSHQKLNAEPNLTPILDMVFQLVTFFMLVINFKAASLDMSLQLPVIGSALPVESGERDVLVLNIARDGKLRMYGEVQDVETCIAKEARTAQQNAAATAAKSPGENGLPTTIIVRADRATPYHYIHQVIRACQAHGFRSFQYRALSGGGGT